MENQNYSQKKGNGSIIMIILLIIAVLGLVCYICYDKGILFSKKETASSDTTEKAKTNTKDTTEKTNSESNTSSNDAIFANDKIHVSYYETTQEEFEKYILTLINTGDNNGYFTLRYVSADESGSEAPSTNGYYSIKDNKLNLSVGPYTNDSNLNTEVADSIFKKAGANLEVDPEQDWRSSNPPSYYKMYSTSNNEQKITIGNKTFYKVN